MPGVVNVHCVIQTEEEPLTLECEHCIERPALPVRLMVSDAKTGQFFSAFLCRACAEAALRRMLLTLEAGRPVDVHAL